MQNKPFNKAATCTWRRYCRGGWAIMASLNRQTRIGVLSVAMLGTAQVQAANKGGDNAHNGEQAETADSLSMDEVTVTGSVAPLTALQSARIVQVITRDDIARAAAGTVNDLLKSVTGVDVRQRGGFGVQTDISIDGGTFDQITVLLNGVDITNPQTGHHSADFPISASDIERIEVLEGAASRTYGNAAFGGAINIVTRRGGKSLEASAEGGSFGSFGTDARIALDSHSLSGGFKQSDGWTACSAFRKTNAYYSGHYDRHGIKAFWQAGLAQKQYDANTFYSAAYPNQWEGERRYIASAGLETQGRVHVSPTVYWNRSTDNFELTKNSSSSENFHRTDVYGVELKAHMGWKLGKTAFGADVRNEGILSTSLGRPMDTAMWVGLRFHDDVQYTHQDNRTQVGYYVEHNLLLAHWTVSAGMRAVMNTSTGSTFRYYPGVDMAWRPDRHWKVYASYNKGFRMPTFTDLYYKSPTLEGNIGLRPEETHSVQIGTRYTGLWAQATVRGFCHRGKRMIDWVMYSHSDIYHSTAFDLDNIGMQATADFSLDKAFGMKHMLRLAVGYTFIHQKRHDSQQIFKSNYALEYLRHKLTARLTHPIVGSLCATWDFRLCDRNGAYIDFATGKLTPYSTYAVVDMKLLWDKPHYEIWVSGENLCGRRYHDLGNIPQPGLWVMAGARLKITL